MDVGSRQQKLRVPKNVVLFQVVKHELQSRIYSFLLEHTIKFEKRDVKTNGELHPNLDRNINQERKQSSKTIFSLF